MEEEKGFNIDKEKNFSEWYTEVLKQAELIDQRYPVKGFLVHMPNATKTEEIMYRIYEEELEKRGHKKAMFPAVIPEHLLTKEKEHIEEFSAEVFWVTHGSKTKLEEKLALRPTSETAMYHMYSTWIRSWRDLPLKIYQSCQVWRYETKATRPLLRDREFYWLEAHDVFATKKEAERQVLEDMDITERVVYKRFGIPFLFFKRPEWDKFGGAVYTFAADGLYPNGKLRQLPSTHLLGEKFSKIFNIKYIDEHEKEHFVWQTCYGPAISTMYSGLIAIHGDNKGLRLPFELAPVQVVIVPIITKAGKATTIIKRCKELLQIVEDLGYRVVLDKTNKRPGAKFYYWELRGVPVRFEIGENEVTSDSVTVHRRDTDKKEMFSDSKISEYLKKAEKQILENLKEQADEKFKGHMKEASSLEGLKKVLEEGGFARIMFCSREMDGKKCADILKEKTEGGEIRGTLHGKNEKAKGKCIVCSKKAKVVVYAAKAY